MASQLINVVVNSKGAVTVKKQLTEIGESAKSTTTYLNGLRAVLAAALTFSGAGALSDTIDQFTTMTNRLKQVSDGSDTVANSWQRLLNIANDSYSTIDGTVNLYFKVAQAYKAWGESAEEAYEFTDLFQKAAILSGSSMQTTSQAVYQFSQALNKGKLDGDEFRSVLEGLPYVATLIQNALGVTRAELYDMSREGKISVDQIKQAFEGAADVIRGDWTNITPTIGMAIEVLRNQWIDFIGDIQTATGIFSYAASAILLIANNFHLLAAAMAPVVVSFAFLAGRLALGLVVTGLTDMYAIMKPLIASVWALNFAMLANPFVLVGMAIAAVVAGLVYFRNEIGLTNENLMLLWTAASTVFSAIGGFVSSVVGYIVEVVAKFVEWTGIFPAIGAAAETTREVVVDMFTSVIRAGASVVSYFGSAFGGLFSQFISLGQELFGLLMDIVDIHVNAWGPAVLTVWDAIKQLWKYTQPALRMFVSFLSDILKGWQVIASWLRDHFAPIVKDVFDGWIGILRTVIGWVQSLISALRKAVALMQQAGGGGGGTGSPSPGAHYGFQGYAGEFASGGAFKVGGTNSGRDTTPVSFRAERGERVTVETKKQQRANDNSGSVPSVNVPVQVVNVLDPSLITGAMGTAAGARQIVNVFSAHRAELRSILGVD